MRKILCLMMCLPMLAHAQEEKGIHFEQGMSLDQIKIKARTENKYIFMDLYATWCGPCKMMDKEVYPNDAVGNYMNNTFISVKVQMDSNANDNNRVKSWYADVHTMQEKYDVHGYPSFLFLSPDGKLVYKGLGFQAVPEFLKLAGEALNPQNILYYGGLEEYKKGKKMENGMRELAMYAKNIGEEDLAQQLAGDYINHTDHRQLLTIDNILLVLDIAKKGQLADSLAAEYKRDSLDPLSEEELCTPRNLNFFSRFYKNVHSTDNFFHLCYNQPEKVDKVMGYKGWADMQVEGVIERQELGSKLLIGEKPLIENPDWNELTAVMHTKYPKVDEKRLTLNYQIFYYKKLNQWAGYAKYQDQVIKNYPITSGFWDLNIPAWNIFLNCNDKKVLAKALEWSELSVKSYDPDTSRFDFLDTRANLLYKLGRVKEAVVQEEQALQVALACSKKEGGNVKFDLSQAGEIKNAIQLMKKGQPTYLNEGAVWNAATLPKKARKK